MSIKNNQKGFTLVELVIVLAIAAIILAGVLVAVGGAQRSSRDSQRKSEAGRLATSIENYASNNAGSLPTGVLPPTYTNGIVDVDTGGSPAYGTTNLTSANYTTTPVQYSSSQKCTVSGNAKKGPMVAANARSYAILYYSENDNASQCIDNQ